MHMQHDVCQILVKKEGTLIFVFSNYTFIIEAEYIVKPITFLFNFTN